MIVKLGAAGDVVRTTTLLKVLKGDVDWLVSTPNRPLISTLPEVRRVSTWDQRDTIRTEKYDLIINLEDDFEVATFVSHLRSSNIFGAYADGRDRVAYTPESSPWFDLSIISVLGIKRANALKMENRFSYQELLFASLGFKFDGEPYSLPNPQPTNLNGDVAIAVQAGPVWPNKNWAYYQDLAALLNKEGYRTTLLPHRAGIEEHIGDISNHRLLLSGDSLPMHIGLGLGLRCCTIFTCTSPWEIYDYGHQYKIISPTLEKYFYVREFHEEATKSIPLDIVLKQILSRLEGIDRGLNDSTTRNEDARSKRKGSNSHPLDPK